MRKLRRASGLYESTSDLQRRDAHSRSFTEDLGRWLTTHPLWPLLPLAYKLLSHMVFTGWLWIWMTLRVLLFSMVLLPAFLRASWFYVTSSTIRRNVRFGTAPRNLMDIYFPPTTNERVGKRPVVLYVTGGAWIIGYKAWGALLARALARAGVITVSPDYRNWPMGTAGDMIEDIDLALTWVQRNIDGFGGDPSRIFVVGQSAGAHLTAMVLIRRAQRQASSDSCISESDPLDASLPDLLKSNGSLEAPATNDQLRAFIGLSGPYDLEMVSDVFHKRGLHKTVFNTIFEGRVHDLSPTVNVKQQMGTPSHLQWVKHLPPMYLVHGSHDKTCPVASTINFAQAINEVGGGITPPIHVRIYQGKGHTDPIIEDLMYHRGDGKDFVGDVMQVIHNELGFEEDAGAEERPRKRTLGKLVLGGEDEASPEPEYMLPLWVIKIGRFVNPF